MSESANDGSAMFAPIEHHVAELATSHRLPVQAVVLCTARYAEAAPLLLAAMARAADGKLAGKEEDDQGFRSIFIVAGRRDPRGFDLLLRFLHRPIDEVDWLLSDAGIDALPRLVAGVFDGNADALFETIVDLALDEFIREALLRAAAFLTWDGRIERGRMVRFLERFDAERLVPDEDFCWVGWLQAITLLGLRDMAATARRAWDRGAFGDYLTHEKFTADLDQAENLPADIERFTAANLGYVDDVLAALLEFPDMDDEWSDEFDDSFPSFALPSPAEPAFNRWRHVGRNDPCLCGSGKKAKRCCMPS